MAHTQIVLRISAFLLLVVRSDASLRGTKTKGEKQGKLLCSAEDVINQFEWDGMYSSPPKKCTNDLNYKVTSCPLEDGKGQHETYGLVLKNKAKTGNNLYPDFNAVTWASNSAGIGDWLDVVCTNATSPDDAVCNILPGTVGLGAGDAYAVAAFDMDQLPPAMYKLVQPTWMNLARESVIPHTYDYVFNKFKDKFSDFKKFKESCVPDQSVFLALEKNGPSQGEPGLKAYTRIVEDYGAQMREVGCATNDDYSAWDGSCRCQSISECDVAVQKFCGTNSSVCDPSPYLCPSDGTSPVGYVRAYLEYFLDALPGFRGTGFGEGADGETHGEDGEPEYIVSPNIPKIEKGVHITKQSVQCSV